MATHTCRDCGKQFTVNTRGRPPAKCQTCREGKGGEPVMPAPKAPDKDATFKERVVSPEGAKVKATVLELSPDAQKKLETRGTIPAREPRTVEQVKELMQSAGGDIPSALATSTPEMNVFVEPASRKHVAAGDAAYEVIVSNYGFAYRGESKSEAKKIYEDFVKKSIAGYGQVGRENVVLKEKGEPIETFDPAKELV